MNEERCVCCGEIIPEGSHVCPWCSAIVMKDLPEGRAARDIPMCPIRESMLIGYRYRCRQCGKEVDGGHQYCPSCGQRQNWSRWTMKEE